MHYSYTRISAALVRVLRVSINDISLVYLQNLVSDDAFVKTIYHRPDLAIVLHDDSPLFLAAVRPTCTDIYQYYSWSSFLR